MARLLTEEEARETWCPMARNVAYLKEMPTGNLVAISSANRNKENEPIAACIASKCAMWEWASGDQLWEANKGKEKGLGYCGLKRGTP